MTTIAIGADHGGYELKTKITEFLKKEKYDVMDLGTHSKESCDYPVIGFDINQERIAGINQGHDSTLEVEDDNLKSVLSINQLQGNGLYLTSKLDEIRDCNVYIVTVPTPAIDVLKERISWRVGQPIPWEVVQGMIDNFEYPTNEEGFKEIWYAT